MAEWFGEAPAQSKACDLTSDKKFCDNYHAADPDFWKRVYYWNTPVRTAVTTAVMSAWTTTTGSTPGPRSRADRNLEGRRGRIGAERPAPKRSVGRRLADLFHGRPRLQVAALLAGAGRLAGHRLPGLARGPAGRLVLGRRRAQRRDLPRPSPRTTSRRSRRSRSIATVALADRSASQRRSPSPTSSWRSRSPSTWRRWPSHGSKALLVDRGAHAAVVVLPGEGLCLADDALPRRRAQLGA